MDMVILPDNNKGGLFLCSYTAEIISPQQTTLRYIFAGVGVSAHFVDIPISNSPKLQVVKE